MLYLTTSVNDEYMLYLTTGVNDEYMLYLTTGVYEEVKAMREACGEAHLKTILATGELGNMVNVYKASLVCMMAGRF